VMTTPVIVVIQMSCYKKNFSIRVLLTLVIINYKSNNPILTNNKKFFILKKSNSYQYYWGCFAYL